MKKMPEFTIGDLVNEPVDDYGNFDGENRIFNIFETTSSEMLKLNEGDKFGYKRDIYQIKMKMPLDTKHSKNIQFYCRLAGNLSKKPG